MRGVTLIETLLYTALLSLLMAGAIGAAHSVMSSSARSDAVGLVTAEGNFVMDKMKWSRSNDRHDVFSADGTRLTMNGSALNGPDVQISQFTDAISGGLEHVTFMLSTRTTDGYQLSRRFETTLYAQ